MTIYVTGPDGAVHEFPDGTSPEVIRRTLGRHYGTGPETAKARASAAKWAADKTGASKKRSVWERFTDDASEVWNTSAVVAGFREGRLKAAEGIRDKKLPNEGKTFLEQMMPELNPGKILGQGYASVEAIVRAIGPDNDKEAFRATVASAQAPVTSEGARRQRFHEVSELDDWRDADGGFWGKTAHGAAALGGTLGGAALDPISWVSGGRSLLERMLVQAGIAGIADVAAQQSDMETGLQDEFSLDRTLLSAGTGAAFTGLLEGGGKLVGNLFPKQKPKGFDPEGPIDSLLREELDAGDLLNRPAMSEAEIPATLKPTTLPAVVEPLPKARGESPKAEAEGVKTGELLDPAPLKDAHGAKPEQDPWDGVSWGEVGSEARKKAAMAHRESLRKFIKPDQVEAFVKWLGHEKVGSPDANHWNERFFDFDKLRENPEQFFELHNALSDIFRPVYDEAGDAARSWDATHQKVTMFGISMSDAIKAHADLVSEGGASAKIHALETIAIQHTDKLYQSMVSLEREVAKGDFSNVGKFAEEVQATVLMDAMAAGAKSEIGRALNIMKMAKQRARLVNDLKGQFEALNDALGGSGDKRLDPESLGTILQRMKKAYEKKGAAGLKDEVRKVRSLGFTDYLGYLITGGLLSAPKTFLRNVVGTGLHAVAQVGERYVAAGIGSVRSMTGVGSIERVTFREANAYAGAVHNALMDAFTGAMRAFKDGTPQMDAVSSVEAVPMVPFKITPERRAMWMRKGVAALPDMLASSVFSLTRTLGFRPSVASDEFFKVLSTRMQIAGLAHREAAYRSARVGGKESEKVFKDTLDAILSEPTDAAIRQAKSFFEDSGLSPDRVYGGAYGEGRIAPHGANMAGLDDVAERAALILKSVDVRRMAEDHARMVAFQKVGPKVQLWEKALRTIPIVKFLYVPFFRTPMALLKAGMVDRNPAFAFLSKDNAQAFGALLKSIRDAEAKMERGGAEADLVLARVSVGAGLMAWAWWMWSNGDLVGRRGEPGDQTRSDGVLPYSLRVGDQWYQFSPLSPAAEPLGIVADLAQALHERSPDDEVSQGLVGAVFAAITNNIVNKTAFSGVRQLYTTLYGSGGTGDEARGKAVERGVGQTATSLIPLSTLLKTVAQDQDPVMRDARSILDKFMEATPTLSDDLPARRDFMGRPILRKPGERGAFQTLNTSKVTDDVMDQELSRLAKVILDFKIDRPPSTFNGQPIDGREHSRVLEVQGQLYRDPRTGLNMEEAVRALMGSEDYAYMPDAQRAYAVKQIVSDYRSLANRAIKDPRSEFYMADMVRRTGGDSLKERAEQRGWAPGVAVKKGRKMGLSDEEAEQALAILNPTQE